MGMLAIDVADAGARYDAQAKSLIAYKDVFARILKGCVPEFEGIEVDRIIRECFKETPQVNAVPVNPGMSAGKAASLTDVAADGGPNKLSPSNSEDLVPGEGLTRFDVIAEVLVPHKGDEEVGEVGCAEKGSRAGKDACATAKIYANVEAQQGGIAGKRLISRAQFYVARELSRQYGVEFTSPRYESLKRAYSIWLLLDPPDELRGRVMRATFRWFENNEQAKAPQWTGEADLMTVVLVGLTDEAGYTGIARMLGVLFSRKLGVAEKRDILTGEFGIALADSEGDGVGDMGSIAEWLVESTRKEALQEGIEQGIERGRTQGREEGIADMIRRYMGIAGVSLQVALDTLGVTGSMRDAVEKRLGSSGTAAL